MNNTNHKGTLYLVPTPLDFGCDTQAPITDVLPQETLRVAASVTHWITENAKSTRAFLKRVDVHVPLTKTIQENTITELPREVHKKGDHTGEFDAKPLLKTALAGHDVGLASEAGMPAVADPGSSVVRAAHDLGIRVVPLVGPVSLLLALAASGLNGQNFAFVGYLPQDGAARTLGARQRAHHERHASALQNRASLAQRGEDSDLRRTHRVLDWQIVSVQRAWFATHAPRLHQWQRRSAWPNAQPRCRDGCSQ